jgi:hypothetical protein
MKRKGRHRGACLANLKERNGVTLTAWTAREFATAAGYLLVCFVVELNARITDIILKSAVEPQRHGGTERRNLENEGTRRFTLKMALTSGKDSVKWFSPCALYLCGSFPTAEFRIIQHPSNRRQRWWTDL